MDYETTISQSDLIEDLAFLENWFEENDECFITPYIEKHFYEESWNYQWNFMRKNLWFTKAIIDDDQMSNDEKAMELIDSVRKGKSKIIMIVGARNSGKTATAMWLAEEEKNKGKWEKIYYVGKPSNTDLYPKWIEFVEDMDELPRPCFAVIDESSIKYNSRRSMTDINVDFGNRLKVLRHDGISLVLITQNIKMVEIDADRLADIIIYKIGTTYGIRKAKDEISGDFWKQQMLIINRLRPKRKEETMVQYRLGSKSIFRKFENPLPSFWDDEFISKSFRGQINIFKSKKEKQQEEFYDLSPRIN